MVLLFVIVFFWLVLSLFSVVCLRWLLHQLLRSLLLFSGMLLRRCRVLLLFHRQRIFNFRLLLFMLRLRINFHINFMEFISCVIIHIIIIVLCYYQNVCYSRSSFCFFFVLFCFLTVLHLINFYLDFYSSCSHYYPFVNFCYHLYWSVYS